MVPRFEEQLAQVVSRCTPLWEKLDRKSIVITGGTGFFGRWILESIVAARNQLGVDLHVTVITRNSGAFATRAPHIAASNAIRFHQTDMTDFRPPEGRVDFVIHGAATPAKDSFQGIDTLSRFDTAVSGMRSILELASRSGAEKMLMLSSGSIYGEFPDSIGSVPESYLGAPSPLSTEASLGHGKRVSEFLCSYYAETFGLSVTIARCFSFVGAFLPLTIQYAIGNFIRDALLGDAIIVRSDGSPVRSYMFMGDLVVWLLTLLLHGQTRTAYNVGSDDGHALGDVARLVGQLLAPEKPVLIQGEKSDQPRRFYVPDVSLARSQFDLSIWTSLEDGIRNTSSAYQEIGWTD